MKNLKLKQFLAMLLLPLCILFTLLGVTVTATSGDPAVTLEQQEAVNSSNKVTAIRYIATVTNVTSLDDVSDVKLNLTLYKYGTTMQENTVSSSKLYTSVSGTNGKSSATNTYYAVFTLTNATSFNDYTLSAYVSLVFNESTTIKSDEISYTINDSGDDFIYSMDASAVPSLENVGVTYKNFDGEEEDVFKILADNGINYIRVRIWNDPYDTSDRPYGGGNTDLANAIKIGKRASKYGLKLLVDFHYSDFWADPGKQNLPKEWSGYSTSQVQSAIYDWTYDSLKEMLDDGIDIGMVQVGNETNDAMAGSEGESTMATVCGYMSKGCAAVRAIATAYNKDILVALHFANPSNVSTYEWFASQLKSNSVDYDVFGTSYYPYWHGSITNLTSVLTNIATTYSKKVMVLETSYANCEMTDSTVGSDGSANTVYTRDYELPGKVSDSGADENAYLPYSFTVEGQKNQILTVINAIAGIRSGTTQYGIGVSYWEGTWIGAYQALTANGGTYASYNDVWATGCGWATSYCSSYDSDDYDVSSHGGCSVENEAFFKYDGTPYESLKLWKTPWYQAGSSITNSSYNGANLVNAGFENADMDGWTYTDGAAWPSTSYYYADSYGCASKGTATNVYQDISGSSGTYKFSAYVMGDSSSSVYIYVSINGTVTKTTASPTGTWSTGSSGFKKYTTSSFTISATDTVYVGVYFPASWWGYIDNCSLTCSSATAGTIASSVLTEQGDYFGAYQGPTSSSETEVPTEETTTTTAEETTTTTEVTTTTAEETTTTTTTETSTSTSTATVATLSNASFEDDYDDWTLTDNASIDTLKSSSKAYSLGSYALNFWSESASDVDFSLTQDISGTKTGSYTFTMDIMGGKYTDSTIYVYASVNGVITQCANTYMTGWNSSSFTTMSVSFSCEEDDTVIVGVYVKCPTADSWGYLDNATLTYNS